MQWLQVCAKNQTEPATLGFGLEARSPTFWFVAKHSIQLSYSRIPQEKYLSLTAYK